MDSSFNVNITHGLLEPVLYLPSPHQDERPAAASVDLLVIHGISLPPSQFGTQAVEAFFCGHLDVALHPEYAKIAHLRVSAHLFIKRSGEVVQFVPFNKRAWHAGVSYFQGRTHCNDFSIGIELEGTDEIPYELLQYQQLAKITCLLQVVYPAITPERIVGHVDIAPGRKTDPGPLFDWDFFRSMLA